MTSPRAKTYRTQLELSPLSPLSPRSRLRTLAVSLLLALGTIHCAASGPACQRPAVGSDASSLAAAAKARGSARATGDAQSEEFEELTRLIESERWLDAWPVAEPIIQGKTSDGDETRQLATYYRAVCVFHLTRPKWDFLAPKAESIVASRNLPRWPTRPYAVELLGSIAMNTQHVRHADTAPMLLALDETEDVPLGYWANFSRPDIESLEEEIRHPVAVRVAHAWVAMNERDEAAALLAHAADGHCVNALQLTTQE